MVSYDVVGNVAIVKFDKSEKARGKRKFADKLFKENKSVRTILEKTGKFSGRLRKLKTKYIAGDKTKEVLYKENGCLFRFNVDDCYFSPRLSSERKEIAEQVRKGEDVLVMFGGVAPYGIVIGKLSLAKRVVSIEISKACNKYAKENVVRNKLKNVEVVQGDVRRVCGKLGKFDRVIMARPNLKDSFLGVGFSAIKNGGIIHYYGFYNEEEVEGKENKLNDLILYEAQKAGKKIKILRVKRAGDIAPYKFRYRIDLKVLN